MEGVLTSTRLAISAFASNKDQTLLETVFTHLLVICESGYPFVGSFALRSHLSLSNTQSQLLTKMLPKLFATALLAVALLNGIHCQQMFSQQPPQAQAPSQPQPQSQQPPATQGPQINWGKCPQLEPSEKEKMTKAQVITKCLETTPLPQNITRDTVELHREQIAACALQSEGWFTANNAYDFGKAETEIKNKQLTKQIEDQVLGYHKQCKEEAEEKFPNTKNTVIAQIQLYQACMDYFISDVCGIEVNEPEAPQFTGAQL
ncbi:unnamed protein product [Medioppia subpectinata]|uniref:Uncharacterized protein n=1 Tax=Medioppia subpectinata TaxID=1979941 RepID=A0A7R9Q2U4_9ACAR|nr:unnamed protein product [Medioppia subpectinata]CAG2109788.1 unnamed protein product [Medioppia subpectinata]